MRTRTLKPAFFSNEELAQCDPLARILFQGLWCMADRNGILEDRPARIKALILPHDNADVCALLAQLASNKLITRYEARDKKCILIPAFTQHQHPHKDEPESGLPKSPEKPRNPRRSREIPDEICPITLNSIPDTLHSTPLPPKGVDAVKIPGELDTPEARQALEDYKQHRREKKKPVTPKSLEKLFAEYAPRGAARFVAAINHSIANGWTGLFEPDSARGPPKDFFAGQVAFVSGESA